MSTTDNDRRILDLRALSDPDAMLQLERSAAGWPGERIEVISDNQAFTIGLLRWCGEGYGRIESMRRSKGRDDFRLQLPTREECAAVGVNAAS